MIMYSPFLACKRRIFLLDIIIITLYYFKNMNNLLTIFFGECQKSLLEISNHITDVITVHKCYVSI